MSSKTLNQLAADYADGIISKDTYRQARNDLFRAIIDGNVNVENNEYLAPLEPGNDLETTTHKTEIQLKSSIFPVQHQLAIYPVKI